MNNSRTKSKSRNWNKRILATSIFLFLLSCVNFFSPQFLSIKIEEQTAKMFIYCFYVLLLIICIGNRHAKKNDFDICFKLIVLSMPFSIIMASTQHSSQPILVSIIATLPYFVPYSAFFLLKRMGMPIDKVEKIVLLIGAINVLLVFQLYALMPNQLFGGLREEDDGRGIRIGIDGDIFKMCLFFYSIYKYKYSRRIKWLIISVLCFITVLLSLTRQVMLISTALAILYFLKDVSLYKKILVAAFFSIAVFGITKIPYFEELIRVTERQYDRERGEEDIRVTAAKYYADKAQVNLLTRILGNGCYSYGNSQYGNDAKRHQYLTLCFPSDVGLVSFYHFFGLFAIAGIILIVYKTFIMKVPRRYEYLKYVIYYIMLASIASGPLLYISQSIVLATTCFLLGSYKYENE